MATDPSTADTDTRVPFSHYAALLREQLRPHTPRVLLLALFMFSGIGLGLINPQLLRYFIDTAKAGGAVRALLMAAGAFIGISIARQLITLVSSYLGQDIGWRVTNRMRGELALHCLNLDMWFHNARTPGEMVERVDGDTTTMANFFSEFVVQVIANALLLVGVLVFVWIEDWRVGVALTLFSALALYVYNLTRSVAVPLYAAEREGYSRLYGFLEERLVGIEDIRTNGGIPHTMDRFYEENDEVYGRVRRAEIMGELLRAITGVLFAFGHALAMGLCIVLYREGTFNKGAVFLIFNYTAMLRRPLFNISRQINDLQRATAGMGRIDELYRTTSKIEDGSRPMVDDPALAVEFDGVTFEYVEGQPVLRDVSFELAPGKTLGLLGRTGSGKTTITRLLFRLYDPQHGDVLLGGAPVTEMPADDLRKRVALVTQDVQIFQASVRENLALFGPDVDDARIMQALEGLGLSDWALGLPDGLDTEITSSTLSAGEAQLLAFTRVFLRDPGLVILDEP
ncbi:ABC transporter ATP-binding protein, partial [Candidatus Poribacteria bacterium]|nr:ABC transporter ATP-binding protein [Candidatus Poribacteria bacterium]